jgi:hypothetical protein
VQSSLVHIMLHLSSQNDRPLRHLESLNIFPVVQSAGINQNPVTKSPWYALLRNVDSLLMI